MRRTEALESPVRHIDAHHHLWDLSAREHAWLDGPGMVAIRRDFTLRDLADEAGANRIDRTILVQVLPELEETMEFLALAAGSDLVAGVIGWVDLTSERVPDVLVGLKTRHLPPAERADVFGGTAARVYRLAQAWA